MKAGGEATAVFQRTMLDALTEATLGDYEILAELGQGGMATVFLAHDIQLDRKVAIKVMSPALLEGEGMIERFKLEARTAASLSHPHIIPIFAVRETKELLFFVMKFVEGRPLDSIIKEIGPLPIPMVRTILSKVGESLGYAHRNGVVHRDIKPANIMIDVEGMPVVTDFGIAKVADKQGLTMTGATIGTPTYMSPEQCMAGAITGASDQYSLGVVAYEMLTGKPPFDADTVMTIMYMHCHEDPREVTEIRTDCPEPLPSTVLRMLAKKPEDRWPSMEEAIANLGGAGALSFDHPVRTQMIDLAKAGMNEEILKRVSTPRSPIPVGVTGRAGGGPASHPEAATVKMESAPRTSVGGTLPPQKRRAGWIIGGLAVAAAAGAVVWLAPWRGESESVPAGPARAQVAQPAGVVRLQLTPVPGELTVGSSVQLSATALDGANNAVAGVSISWTSGDTSVATVSAAGMVFARAPGTTVVTASSRDQSATTEVSVGRPAQVSEPARPRATRAAVVSINVFNPPASVVMGTTAQLRAVPRDKSRNPLPDRQVVWKSNDPSVGRIDAATGVLTGVSAGTVIVTASSEGKSASATLKILPEPVVFVSIVPSNPPPLTVGQTVRLAATGLSARNTQLSGRGVEWSSSNTHVATVTDGLVIAHAAGTTSITAEIDGKIGSATVSVNAAPVTTPEPVNDRQAISDVIQLYARALELHDMQQVRRIHPGLTSKQESDLRRSLDIMKDLKVALEISDLAINGDQAEATLSGSYKFRNTASGRDENTSVTFHMTLRRGPNGWRITETSN
ncbi:MAG: protein kinase [Gemmatimonadales bacterium]